MKRQRIACAALAAALAVGICPAGYANAASVSETPIETSSTGEGAQTGAQAKPAKKSPLTTQELAQYYGESVFIGDSIMLGFRNYSAKKNTFVRDIKFLAVGSYSAYNAMKPVAGNNVHPLYEGKKYNLWDALPLIGRQRAFILLGMNDISILGLEGARDKYKELIGKILETSPDIEINIISVTYTLKDKGKGKLNNGNIDKYNVMLKKMADENGWGYIDLCTPVSDMHGNLAPGACSDGFVHLSRSAYAIWEQELVKYANNSAGQKEKTAQSTSETAQIPTIETPQIPTAETAQIPAIETPQIPTAETAQIPTAETPQIPTAETAQIPTAETPQIPTIETAQIPTIETPQIPTAETAQIPTAETVPIPTIETVQIPIIETVQIPTAETQIR